MFPNMKEKLLDGNQYRTDHEVISGVDDLFEVQGESSYSAGIETLQQRWEKCADRMGMGD